MLASLKKHPTKSKEHVALLRSALDQEKAEIEKKIAPALHPALLNKFRTTQGWKPAKGAEELIAVPPESPMKRKAESEEEKEKNKRKKNKTSKKGKHRLLKEYARAAFLLAYFDCTQSAGVTRPGTTDRRTGLSSGVFAIVTDTRMWGVPAADAHVRVLRRRRLATSVT